MRVVRDDEPRVARAERVQVLQHLLAVVEDTDSVDDQNEIKWPGQCPDERFILDVADKKREIRVGLAGLRDHSRAEVHANAEGRFQFGEQVARATSELEDSRALRNQKSQVEQVFTVEVCPAR